VGGVAVPLDVHSRVRFLKAFLKASLKAFRGRCCSDKDKGGMGLKKLFLSFKCNNREKSLKMSR